MRWFKFTSLLLFAGPACALEGYVVGLGLEGDSADGIAGSFSLDLGLTEKTWLSVAAAKSSLDLPRGGSLDSRFGQLGIDHWFEPLGVSLGIAYWDASDILNSTDYLGEVYWRGDNARVALDIEYRDFSFDVFRRDALAGQDVEFHADGIGLSARFSLTQSIDLNLAGIDYNYNVNLGRAANQPITDFQSVSRLSLINSLVDFRANVGLGFDIGKQRWSLDYASWLGEVDGSRTTSTTLRFLTPMGQKSDVEFGIGVDDSDIFGSISFFSVHLFFYGD